MVRSNHLYGDVYLPRTRLKLPGRSDTENPSFPLMPSSGWGVSQGAHWRSSSPDDSWHVVLCLLRYLPLPIFRRPALRIGPIGTLPANDRGYLRRPNRQLEFPGLHNHPLVKSQQLQLTQRRGEVDIPLSRRPVRKPYRLQIDRNASYVRHCFLDGVRNHTVGTVSTARLCDGLKIHVNPALLL